MPNSKITRIPDGLYFIHIGNGQCTSIVYENGKRKKYTPPVLTMTDEQFDALIPDEETIKKYKCYQTSPPS